MKKILFKLLFFLTVVPAISQSDTVVIPFENEDEAKELQMRIFQGSINIIGTDRKDVLVKYEKINHPDGEECCGGHGRGDESEDGMASMKVLSDSNADIQMGSKNNRAYVRTKNWNKFLKVEVEVPADIQLNIYKETKGDVSVSNLTGNINIESNIGAITASGIQGIINASTHHGDITVKFDRISDAKNMILANSDGNIDVTFPASPSATLKMKTMMGQIYGDLEVDISDVPGKIENEGGEFKYSVGGWTFGTIGTGGPEITMNTYNGSIFLRKD